MKYKKLKLSSIKYPGYYAKLDPADYELVKDMKWHLHHTIAPHKLLPGQPNRIYAVTNIPQDTFPKSYIQVVLHKYILGLPPGLDPQKQVDHANQDGLDCRRQNLRICTGSENQCNRRRYRSNTSGYKGVSWSKDHKKWVVMVGKNGKNYFQGYFNDILDAAQAYRRGAKRLHGEFRRIR